MPTFVAIIIVSVALAIIAILAVDYVRRRRFAREVRGMIAVERQRTGRYPEASRGDRYWK